MEQTVGGWQGWGCENRPANGKGAGGWGRRSAGGKDSGNEKADRWVEDRVGIGKQIGGWEGWRERGSRSTGERNDMEVQPVGGWKAGWVMGNRMVRMECGNE